MPPVMPGSVIQSVIPMVNKNDPVTLPVVQMGTPQQLGDTTGDAIDAKTPPLPLLPGGGGGGGTRLGDTTDDPRGNTTRLGGTAGDTTYDKSPARRYRRQTSVTQHQLGDTRGDKASLGGYHHSNCDRACHQSYKCATSYTSTGIAKLVAVNKGESGIMSPSRSSNAPCNSSHTSVRPSRVSLHRVSPKVPQSLSKTDVHMGRLFQSTSVTFTALELPLT